MNMKQLFERALQPAFEMVDIAGFGSVNIKTPNIGDNLAFNAYFADDGVSDNMGLCIEMICRLVVDENGAPFLTEQQVKQMPQDLFNALMTQISTVRQTETVEEIAKK